MVKTRNQKRKLEESDTELREIHDSNIEHVIKKKKPVVSNNDSDSDSDGDYIYEQRLKKIVKDSIKNVIDKYLNVKYQLYLEHFYYIILSFLLTVL